MSEIEIKNAIIKSVSITTEHGLLDVYIHLNYGGLCQSFGGWVLYLPKSFDHHELKSVAGHHIFRCMEIAGVTSWDQMAGKTIRVKCSWDKVNAIGHIVKDDWYNPTEEFKELSDET